MSLRIAVIGAGISGLAISRLLKTKGLDSTIFERNESYGGIARPRMVSGVPYHLTGGHCFNSNEQKVKDFVFAVFPEENWNKIDRVAKIYFKEKLVDYPIEFSLRQIAEFDQELAYRMFADLMAAPGGEDSGTLSRWFIQTFGKTLSDEYFIPYNEKVWDRDLSEISPSWVNGKLPIPNKQEVFLSLLDRAADKMPHRSFYYPKSDLGQLAFIECLANNLEIKLNRNLVGIKRIGSKWIIDDESYDLVVSTVPLNTAIEVFNFANDSEMQEASGDLIYNSLTTMLWSSEEIERTWTYFPSSDILCHRHIHIGSFLRPTKGYTITEAVGVKTRDEMIEDGRKITYLNEPLDFHVGKYAYVVENEKAVQAKTLLIENLQNHGVYQLGRFGEWEYYNMDICILSAMKLVERIVDFRQ